MLTRDEQRFIQTVAADLGYLRDEWDESVDDHSLRRSSAALRILLVDDAYGRAWRLAGLKKQPKVRANSLQAVLANAPRGDITYAQAAGSESLRTSLVAPVLIGSGALADQDAEVIDNFLRRDFTFEYGLREFAESTSICTPVVSVKRREVVQFVANKLGGAHLDLPGSGKENDRYSLLSQVLNQMELMGRPAVYYELLCIGQTLAHSSDAERFLEAVGEFNLS